MHQDRQAAAKMLDPEAESLWCATWISAGAMGTQGEPGGNPRRNSWLFQKPPGKFDIITDLNWYEHVQKIKYIQISTSFTHFNIISTSFQPWRDWLVEGSNPIFSAKAPPCRCRGGPQIRGGDDRRVAQALTTKGQRGRHVISLSILIGSITAAGTTCLQSIYYIYIWYIYIYIFNIYL